MEVLEYITRRNEWREEFERSFSDDFTDGNLYSQGYGLIQRAVLCKKVCPLALIKESGKIVKGTSGLSWIIKDPIVSEGSSAEIPTSMLKVNDSKFYNRPQKEAELDLHGLEIKIGLSKIC